MNFIKNNNNNNGSIDNGYSYDDYNLLLLRPVNYCIIYLIQLKVNYALIF